MSSKTTTSGACSSSSLRNAQAISSADVLSSLSPSSEPIDRGRGRVGRERVELLDHLDHGPIGDPLAVGEAAATDDPHVERGQRFRDEPRLADPRVADDGDELALPGHGALPRLADEPQLAVAADEARLVRSLRCLVHRHEPVCRNRLGLAFQLERLDRFDLDRAAYELEGRLADQDLVGVGGVLQAGGDIDRVPGRQPLLGTRDHLARVHADPSLHAQLRERRPHLHRRPAGAQRVVLVHLRHTEDRHHRVADELLHRALVRLDDRLHPLEVAGQQRLKRLRVDGLAERGRADHVAEQHGDDLPMHSRIIPCRQCERKIGCRLQPQRNRTHRHEPT